MIQTPMCSSITLKGLKGSTLKGGYCHICAPLNSGKLQDPDFQLLGLPFIMCLFTYLNCVFQILLTIMLFFGLPVLLLDIHLTIPVLSYSYSDEQYLTPF